MLFHLLLTFFPLLRFTFSLSSTVFGVGDTNFSTNLASVSMFALSTDAKNLSIGSVPLTNGGNGDCWGVREE